MGTARNLFDRLKYRLTPRGRSPIRNTILTGMLLGAGMQLFPNAASTDMNDFLKEKGYPEALAAHFADQNMRAYERYSPLSLLHVVGRPVSTFQWDDSGDAIDQALGVLSVPINMAVLEFKAVTTYLPSYTGADAFALPTDVEGQACYVYPTSDHTYINDVIARISGLDEMKKINDFNLKSGQLQVEDAIRTMIMAHEMEHCAQNRDSEGLSVYESDSDIVSVALVKEMGYDDGVAEEAVKLFTAGRILSSLGTNTDSRAHDTGLNLLDGNMTPLKTYFNGVSINLVAHLAEAVVDRNDFPADMSDMEQNYHAIKSLLDSGVLEHNGGFAEAERYAKAYMNAFDYLNDVSNGAVIKHPDYYNYIKTAFLTEKGPAHAATSKFFTP